MLRTGRKLSCAQTVRPLCPAHALCLTKSHGWRGADHPPGSPLPC